MNIKIWGEKTPEPVLHLRLVEEGHWVYLAAVDDTGNRLASGSLLKIDRDTGEVFRCSGVSGVPCLDIKAGKLRVGG